MKPKIAAAVGTASGGGGGGSGGGEGGMGAAIQAAMTAEVEACYKDGLAGQPEKIKARMEAARAKVRAEWAAQE